MIPHPGAGRQDSLTTALSQGGKQVDVATATSRSAAKETTLAQRAKLVAQWLWTGQTPAETFFGPGTPLTPVAPQEVEGRMRDFAVSANLVVEPRAEEATRFWELYELANTHDITRLCIETRKDQMARQNWVIRKREAGDKKKFGEVQKDLVEFFKSPDKLETYEQWQGRILEDLFVGDCPAVYVRRALDGSIFGFEPIDGSTILLRLDPWGRVPRQGEAYTQILKGLPAVPYSRDQLIYMPRRPRNQKGYGFSCVEQIIITVNIALKRQFHQLAYYTDGSAPDLIVGVPKDWSEKAINYLKEYWMAHFRGNSREKRGSPLIVVGGNECKFEDTKKEALKDEFDEWLARVICYAFSLPPTPFIRQMNRSTAETGQEAALAEGLAPLMKWWKALIDNMLVRMGRADCEFAFEDEEAIDPTQRAAIHKTYLDTGVLTRNEVRDSLGKDPIPGGDEPLLTPPPTAPPGQPGAPQATPAPASPAGPGKGPAPAPGVAQKMAKNHRALPSRNREDLLKMEAHFALGVAKALNNIRRQVVARVPSGSKLAKDASDGALANLIVSGDFEKLHGLLETEMLDLYQGGVAAAGTVLDATEQMLKVANERGIVWAKAHAAEQVTRISQTTRDGVNELVQQAMEGGWSNDTLADELDKSWEFGADRAELIARTETAMADLKGNIEMSKEAGVERVQWLTAEADACEQCDALDGEEAPIDGEFADGTKADDVAHPACRCDRIAVLPTESED